MRYEAFYCPFKAVCLASTKAIKCRKYAVITLHKLCVIYLQAYSHISEQSTRMPCAKHYLYLIVSASVTTILPKNGNEEMISSYEYLEIILLPYFGFLMVGLFSVFIK